MLTFFCWVGGGGGKKNHHLFRGLIDFLLVRNDLLYVVAHILPFLVLFWVAGWVVGGWLDKLKIRLNSAQLS